MSKGPFSPSQFIPTRWSTAEEKARFGNALLHFVDSGFARNLFTDRLYGRLSNCFGHIAHYVESVIMRSPSVICRVDTAFKGPSTLHNCNRSLLDIAPGLRIVSESRQQSKS